MVMFICVTQCGVEAEVRDVYRAGPKPKQARHMSRAANERGATKKISLSLSALAIHEERPTPSIGSRDSRPPSQSQLTRTHAIGDGDRQSGFGCAIGSNGNRVAGEMLLEVLLIAAVCDLGRCFERLKRWLASCLRGSQLQLRACGRGDCFRCGFVGRLDEIRLLVGIVDDVYGRSERFLLVWGSVVQGDC